MKENNLITIDGISGAGKGTLAKSLALELGYNILDSGNLYRLVGLISKRLSSSASLGSTGFNPLTEFGSFCR